MRKNNGQAWLQAKVNLLLTMLCTWDVATCPDLPN